MNSITVMLCINLTMPRQFVKSPNVSTAMPMTTYTAFKRITEI